MTLKSKLKLEREKDTQKDNDAIDIGLRANTALLEKYMY